MTTLQTSTNPFAKFSPTAPSALTPARPAGPGGGSNPFAKFGAPATAGPDQAFADPPRGGSAPEPNYLLDAMHSRAMQAQGFPQVGIGSEISPMQRDAYALQDLINQPGRGLPPQGSQHIFEDTMNDVGNAVLSGTTRGVAGLAIAPDVAAGALESGMPQAPGRWAGGPVGFPIDPERVEPPKWMQTGPTPGITRLLQSTRENVTKPLADSAAESIRQAETLFAPSSAAKVPWSWRWFAYQTPQTIAQMAPMIAAGAIGGAVGLPSAAVGASVAMAMEAGLTRDDYRNKLADQGFTPSEADRIANQGALAYGVLSGLVETLPLGAIFKKAPGVKAMFLKTLESAVLEGSEEVVQEFINRTTQVVAGIDPKALESMSGDELLQQFVLGGIAGGGFAAATSFGQAGDTTAPLSSPGQTPPPGSVQGNGASSSIPPGNSRGPDRDPGVQTPPAAAAVAQPQQSATGQTSPSSRQSAESPPSAAQAQDGNTASPSPDSTASAEDLATKAEMEARARIAQRQQQEQQAQQQAQQQAPAADLDSVLDEAAKAAESRVPNKKPQPAPAAPDGAQPPTPAPAPSSAKGITPASPGPQRPAFLTPQQEEQIDGMGWKALLKLAVRVGVPRDQLPTEMRSKASRDALKAKITAKLRERKAGRPAAAPTAAVAAPTVEPAAVAAPTAEAPPKPDPSLVSSWTRERLDKVVSDTPGAIRSVISLFPDSANGHTIIDAITYTLGMAEAMSGGLDRVNTGSPVELRNMKQHRAFITGTLGRLHQKLYAIERGYKRSDVDGAVEAAHRLADLLAVRIGDAPPMHNKAAEGTSTPAVSSDRTINKAIEFLRSIDAKELRRLYKSEQSFDVSLGKPPSTTKPKRSVQGRPAAGAVIATPAPNTEPVLPAAAPSLAGDAKLEPKPPSEIRQGNPPAQGAQPGSTETGGGKGTAHGDAGVYDASDTSAGAAEFLALPKIQLMQMARDAGIDPNQSRAALANKLAAHKRRSTHGDSRSVRDDFEAITPSHKRFSRELDDLVAANVMDDLTASTIRVTLRGVRPEFLDRLTMETKAQLIKPSGERAAGTMEATAEKDRRARSARIMLAANLRTMALKQPIDLQPLAVFLEEFGHAGWSLLLSDQQRSAIRAVFDKLTTEQRQAFFPELDEIGQKYAASNAEEFFAHLFVQRAAGKPPKSGVLGRMIERVFRLFKAALARMRQQSSDGSIDPRIDRAIQAVLRGEFQPDTPARKRYTTIDDSWIGRQLYNWRGGVEVLAKGQKAKGMKGRGVRAFPGPYQRQLDRVPSDARRLIDVLYAMTPEVWRVEGSAGGYTLAPAEAVAAAQKLLPDWERDVAEAEKRRAERAAKVEANRVTRTTESIEQAELEAMQTRTPEQQARLDELTAKAAEAGPLSKAERNRHFDLKGKAERNEFDEAEFRRLDARYRANEAQMLAEEADDDIPFSRSLGKKAAAAQGMLGQDMGDATPPPRSTSLAEEVDAEDGGPQRSVFFEVEGGKTVRVWANDGASTFTIRKVTADKGLPHYIIEHEGFDKPLRKNLTKAEARDWMRTLRPVEAPKVRNVDKGHLDAGERTREGMIVVGNYSSKSEAFGIAASSRGRVEPYTDGKHKVGFLVTRQPTRQEETPDQRIARRAREDRIDAAISAKFSDTSAMDAMFSRSLGADDRIDPDKLPREVLSKMNVALKAMGYDSRGADDVLENLKRWAVRDGRINHEDWKLAYERATVSREKRKRKLAAKSEFKHINWKRIRELGTTTDLREAGYLTPTGTLIDLSGKREGGTPGMRSYDHREAGGTPGMQEMMAAGFIRLMPESGGMDISIPPTDAQKTVIRRIVNERRGEVIVDLQDGLGEPRLGRKANGREEVDYYMTPGRAIQLEYPAKTGSQRVLDDIDAFFRGEDVKAPPERQYSRAFHASPHTFDRFSLKYIGTGEGAQVIGWGLYFAGAEDVARFYYKKFSTIKINDQPANKFNWKEEIEDELQQMIFGKSQSARTRSKNDLLAMLTTYVPALERRERGYQEELDKAKEENAARKWDAEPKELVLNDEYGKPHHVMEWVSDDFHRITWWPPESSYASHLGWGTLVKRYPSGVYLTNGRRVQHASSETLEEAKAQADTLPDHALHNLAAVQRTREQHEMLLRAIMEDKVKLDQARWYQVDLKPADDEWLLWDRPLAEQSEKVQKAIASLTPKPWTDAEVEGMKQAGKWTDWHDAQRAHLANEWGKRAEMYYRSWGNDRHASMDLLAAGVRGIKYLDGNSRTGRVKQTADREAWIVTGLGWTERFPTQEAAAAALEKAQTYNYVIFDDADVEIEVMHSRSLNTETPEFKRWFGQSKVVDKDGKPMPMYHGAGRPDRIGTVFRSGRATSGPMAFFTNDPAVASGYAQGKADTSLERPESYAEWFKYKPPGRGRRAEVDIRRMWYFVDSAERERIARTLPHVSHLDEEGNEIDGYRLGGPDEYGVGGKDHWEWTIKEHRGNVVAAAVDIWLDAGTLFDREEEFMQVLRLAGIKGVRFDDPNASYPAVFPVYLRIERPFETNAITPGQIEALQKAANRSRHRPSRGNDMWAKTDGTPADWMQRLREDAERGTTHAWTSIPDWVTRELKRMGYDGIKDAGGKFHPIEHQVWIPFEEGQVKSVHNRGTFDPASRDIMHSRSLENANQDALGFVSKLEQVIKAKVKGQMPAEQFKATLKAGGVTDDEMKWSGAADLQGMVTGEMIRRLRAENRVQLREVVKGGGSKGMDHTAMSAAVAEYDAAHLDIVTWSGGNNDIVTAITSAIDEYLQQDDQQIDADKVLDVAIENLSVDDPAAAQVVIDRTAELAPPVQRMADAALVMQEENEAENGDDVDGERGSPKFASFTLPGGDNYREVLLALPAKEPPSDIYPEPLTELPAGYELITDHEYGRGGVLIEENWGIIPPGQQHAAPHSGLHPTPEAAKSYALDVINRRRKEIAVNEWHAANPQFHSGHFSEPNIIAHLRTTDRTTPDGKRVLFLEEIQSDWHQQGRDRGYAGPWLEAEEREFNALNRRIFDDGMKSLSAEEKSRFKELEQRRDDHLDKRRVLPGPWSKTWHEMAFRRALRIAADGGYDLIGWTTGEQQAERYDLSKQVRAVNYLKNDDGTYELSVVTMRDGLEDIAGDVPAEKLADYVGKDLAKKIIADEGATGFDAKHSPRGWSYFKDVDLKIGGEGMKAFYDRMIPQYASKYAKKWNARPTSATIQTEIIPGAMKDYQNTADVHALPITDAMRQSVITEGQPLFSRNLPPPPPPGEPFFPGDDGPRKRRRDIPQIQAAAIKTASIVIKGLRDGSVKPNTISRAIHDVIRGLRPQLFEAKYKTQLVKVKDAARAIVDEAVRSGYDAETVRKLLQQYAEDASGVRLAYRGGVGEGLAAMKAKLPAIRLEIVRREQAKTLKASAIRKRLVKVIEETLPLSVRGKFLDAVKNVRTPKGLEIAMGRIAAELARQQMRNDWMQLARATSPSRIKRLTQERREKVQALAVEAADIRTRARAKGVDRAALERLADALRQRWRDIRTIIHEHATENTIKVGQQMVAAAGFRQRVLRALSRRPKLGSQEDRAKARDTNRLKKWLIRWHLTPDSTAQLIDDDFKGRSGAAQQLLVEEFWHGETDAHGEMREFVQAANKIARAAGFADGIQQARIEISGAMGEASQLFLGTDGTLIRGADLKPDDTRIFRLGDFEALTLGQALDIFARDPDTQLQETTRANNFDTRKLADEFMLTPELRMQIEDAIPERLKEFVKSIKQLRDTQFRERLFAAHREIYGWEPPAVDDYHPRRVNREHLPELSQAPIWRATTDRHLEQAGFVHHVRDEDARASLLIGDFLGVTMRQAQASARIIHLAQRVRAAEAVLRDNEVKAAIESRLGESTVKRVEEIIRQGAGTDEHIPEHAMSRLMVGLSRSTSSALTSVNLRTWLRNALGGTMSLAAEMPADVLRRGLSGALSHAVGQRMFKHSEYAFARYAQSPAAIFSMQPDRDLIDLSPLAGPMSFDIKGSADRIRAMRAEMRKGRWKQALKHAHIILRDFVRISMLFDSIPLRVAWAGLEKQALAEHPDWSEQRRMEWVAWEHERIIRRSQNTFSPMDTSGAIATSKQHTWLAPILALSGDVQKKRNMLYQAWLSGDRKRVAKVTAALGIGSVLTSTLVTGGLGYGLYELLAMILGDGDDEFERDVRQEKAMARTGWGFAKELAGMAPGGGQAMEFIEAAATRFKKGERMVTPTSSQFLELVQAGWDLIEGIKRAAMSEEDWEASKLQKTAGEYFAAAAERGGLATLNLMGISISPSWWLVKGAWPKGSDDPRSLAGQRRKQVEEAARKSRLPMASSMR